MGVGLHDRFSKLGVVLRTSYYFGVYVRALMDGNFQVTVPKIWEMH